MNLGSWTDNISWLRRIPENWTVTKVGRVTRLRDDRNEQHCSELLSLSAYTGVQQKNYEDENQVRSGEELEKYWTVLPKQLVVNPMWQNHGSIAVSSISGVISPDYRVYEFREDILPAYAHYVFRSSMYLSLYGVLTRGHTTYDRRISKEDFASLPFAIPPLKEQRIIADYLDCKTAAIDMLSEKKRRLVTLLSEKRTELVNQAMKSSVASSVKTIRLGHLLHRVKRQVDRISDNVYQPIGMRSFGLGTFRKEILPGSELGDSDFFWVKQGDLIFSGPFSWEGAVAIAHDSDTDCVVSHRFPTFRFNRELVEPYYLLAFFKTPPGRFLLSENSNGAAGRNRPLNINTLMKERIPLPLISVQKKIAEFAHTEEQVATFTQKSLDLLEEYRHALISGTITGKTNICEEVA